MCGKPCVLLGFVDGTYHHRLSNNYGSEAYYSGREHRYPLNRRLIGRDRRNI